MRSDLPRGGEAPGMGRGRFTRDSEGPAAAFRVSPAVLGFLPAELLWPDAAPRPNAPRRNPIHVTSGWNYVTCEAAIAEAVEISAGKTELIVVAALLRAVRQDSVAILP